MIEWSTLKSGYNPLAEYVSNNENPISVFMSSRLMQSSTIDFVDNLPEIAEFIIYTALLMSILVIALGVLYVIFVVPFKRIARW